MNAYDAVEALIGAVAARRADAVVAAYEDGPATYVFPEGPRWSTVSGAAVARGWRAWLDAGNAIDAWHWVEGPYEGTEGDLAWVAGILDLDVRSGAGPRTLRLRGTYVLRRTAAGWRIVHEHFSQPAPDPYGTGDWLPSHAGH